MLSYLKNVYRQHQKELAFWTLVSDSKYLEFIRKVSISPGIDWPMKRLDISKVNTLWLISKYMWYFVFLKKKSWHFHMRLWDCTLYNHEACLMKEGILKWDTLMCLYLLNWNSYMPMNTGLCYTISFPWEAGIAFPMNQVLHRME